MEQDVLKTQVATLVAEGKSVREGAEELGISKSRFQDIKSQEDTSALIRSIIQSQTARLITTSMERAVTNVIQEIDNYDPEKDVGDRGLSLAYSAKLLERTGAFADKASLSITNIINNNQTLVSPLILNLIQDFQRRIEEVSDE